MLAALRLGNFKAFGPTQRIPLKPLTLVFGPNSAGKSSIIHSLALAHEARRSGNLDASGTQLGGTSIDLGGFRRYVFRRRPSNNVEWAVELEFESLAKLLPFEGADFGTVVVSVNFGLPRGDSDDALSDSATELVNFTVEVGGSDLIRMSRRRNGGLQIDIFRNDHSLFGGLSDRIVRRFNTLVEFKDETTSVDRTVVDEGITDIIANLPVIAGNFLPVGIEYGFEDGEGGLAGLSDLQALRKDGRRMLSHLVRLEVTRALNRLLSALNGAVGSEIERLQYLGPLRSYPPRELPLSQHDDVNWRAGGGYAWDVLRRDYRVRDRVNEWLGENWLKTNYRLELRELVGLDQLDKPLLAALEAFDGQDQIFGLRFDGDDESDDGSVVYPFFRDLDEAVAQVRAAIGSSTIEKVPELVLVDKRTDTAVSHRDVGIGISQVLPVLVSCYGSRDRIVAIEQPEIHLHPALQSELGDVFIRSALGEQRNHFILETHSEHLMLRILRRIRESAEHECSIGGVSIEPSDVAVLYVKPTPEGAQVVEIPIAEDGDFDGFWPDGFFEDRIRELF